MDDFADFLVLLSVNEKFQSQGYREKYIEGSQGRVWVKLVKFCAWTMVWHWFQMQILQYGSIRMKPFWKKKQDIYVSHVWRPVSIHDLFSWGLNIKISVEKCVCFIAFWGKEIERKKIKPLLEGQCPDKCLSVIFFIALYVYREKR